MSKIDARTLRHRDDVPIIDVRTAGEYASGRAPGSVNVPLDKLQASADRIAVQLDGPVALMCASGQRAEQAREALAAAGHDDALVLEGGMSAWQEAGGEPVSERAVWPMERQVRFAAGSMVLAGALASVRWRPAIALPAFVGSGLAFSGLTGACGMAVLLARMPWNRAGGDVDVDGALEGLRQPQAR